MRAGAGSESRVAIARPVLAPVELQGLVPFATGQDFALPARVSQLRVNRVAALVRLPLFVLSAAVAGLSKKSQDLNPRRVPAAQCRLQANLARPINGRLDNAR